MIPPAGAAATACAEQDRVAFGGHGPQIWPTLPYVLRQLIQRVPTLTLGVAMLSLAACGGIPDAIKRTAGQSRDSGPSASSTAADLPPLGSTITSADYLALVKPGNAKPFKLTGKYSGKASLERLGPYVISNDPPRTAIRFGPVAVFADGAGTNVVCRTSGTPVCTKSASETPVAGTTLTNVPTSDVKRVAGRRSLNRELACFTFTTVSVGATGSFESCIDPATRITLWAQFSVPGGTPITLEVTKIEAPRASDFTIPAPVR